MTNKESAALLLFGFLAILGIAMLVLVIVLISRYLKNSKTATTEHADNVYTQRLSFVEEPQATYSRLAKSSHEKDLQQLKVLSNKLKQDVDLLIKAVETTA